MLALLLMILFGASTWASPGLDSISKGDLAHYQGLSKEARIAYREAVESKEPAAEAMGRLRLLAYSGNWGAWVHGPAIDRALRNAEGPAADLAWLDFHLFAPAFVGASREEAVRLAQELLPVFPAEATARLFLATGKKEWLVRLRTLPERDGMGEAIVLRNGDLPPPPATWNFGVGFSVAPGLGYGAGISFRHGGLRGWATEIWLGGSTLGSGYAVVRAQSLTPVYGRVDAGLLRGVLYRYDASGNRESIWRDSRWMELGPGLRFGSARVWLAGTLRLDDVGSGVQKGHGLSAGATLDTRRGWGRNRRGAYAAVDTDVVLWGDESHRSVFLDGRGYLGSLGGVLALRGTHHQAMNPDVSFFRLPTVGGMTLHRGAPYQRWRAPWISTVDLEQRWMLWGPVEGVVMVNGAFVADNGFHPAGGVGLRLLLPPEESNVSRVDLAFSDTGWGLYAAWGEAF